MNNYRSRYRLNLLFIAARAFCINGAFFGLITPPGTNKKYLLISMHEFKYSSVKFSCKLSSCPITQLSHYRIVSQLNCLVTKTSHYPVVAFQNCQLPSCLVTIQKNSGLIFFGSFLVRCYQVKI